MTMLQRAAVIVASFVSLAGLGMSTQGAAHELAESQSARVPVELQAPGISFLINAEDRIAVPPTEPMVTGEVIAAAAPAFSSLNDAVAAQSGEGDDAGLRCLASAIYFEAKGEPLAGQLAVAQVILNRSRSGRYPSDVCGVVTQAGQFGFVRGGRIPAIDQDRPSYRTARAIAQVALNEAWDGPVDTAMFFNTAGRRGGGSVRVATIGNHVFYR